VYNMYYKIHTVLGHHAKS